MADKAIENVCSMIRRAIAAVRKIHLLLCLIIFMIMDVACSEVDRTQLSSEQPFNQLSPFPTTCTTWTRFPRRFHVEGNTFVDEDGKVMVFRGMSAIDPIYQRFVDTSNHTQWDKSYYRAMAEWGANIIRLPILPSSVRNFGMERTLSTLDQSIAWAAENGLYVIIDYHALGWPPNNYYPPDSPWYSTTPQEVIDFWAAISKRYADVDTVAFYELYNEPLTQASHKDYSGASATREDWLTWKDFMEQIIATVRMYDADKIILVGGLQFAYDLSFVEDAPITGRNIAFATHPYSHPDYTKDWKIAFGDLSTRYPVFATEFGYDGDVSPDDEYDGALYHEAIIEYLEEHHISWTVWVFDASWKPTLLLDNSAYLPSPSGVYFRKAMLHLNRAECDQYR